MKPHIVADESVDFRIIVHLRQKDLIVYSIAEQQPSIKDEAALNIAFENKALLITEDKDFGELVFRLQLPHMGILLIKISDAQSKIEKVVNTIVTHYSELQNKFSVIDSNKLRIKE